MAKTATRSKKDILEIIQAHADQIQLYGIQRLGIFGSFAREQQTSDSDIDLLVDFKAGQKNYDLYPVFRTRRKECSKIFGKGEIQKWTEDNIQPISNGKLSGFHLNLARQ